MPLRLFKVHLPHFGAKSASHHDCTDKFDACTPAIKPSTIPPARQAQCEDLPAQNRFFCYYQAILNLIIWLTS